MKDVTPELVYGKQEIMYPISMREAQRSFKLFPFTCGQYKRRTSCLERVLNMANSEITVHGLVNKSITVQGEKIRPIGADFLRAFNTYFRPSWYKDQSFRVHSDTISENKEAFHGIEVVESYRLDCILGQHRTLPIQACLMGGTAFGSALKEDEDSLGCKGSLRLKIGLNWDERIDDSEKCKPENFYRKSYGNVIAANEGFKTYGAWSKETISIPFTEINCFGNLQDERLKDISREITEAITGKRLREN